LYDQSRIASSIAWIRSNPGRFQQLTLQRVAEFWFPRPGKPAYPAYVIWFVTALSVPGICVMAWRRESISAFVLLALSIYPLMYYVVVTDVRYRYPVLWVSLLSAGYFVRWIAARGYQRQHSPNRRLDIVRASTGSYPAVRARRCDS
jgi:hypothetical protein